MTNNNPEASASTAIIERLEAEKARQPKFDQYPAPASLDLAVNAVLERIEEWDYGADPHGWCHERPLLLALLDAVLNGS